MHRSFTVSICEIKSFLPSILANKANYLRCLLKFYLVFDDVMQNSEAIIFIVLCLKYFKAVLVHFEEFSLIAKFNCLSPLSLVSFLLIQMVSQLVHLDWLITVWALSYVF
jgi:hypothetical protein